MSRSAEGAVGSIRRLGRPRPSQPTRSPRRAPPRQPPPARPAGRPGRATAPFSRRPCRRARVVPPRAPVQSASGQRDRPPFARHLIGAAAGKPARRPFRPRPHLPPTPGGRIPLPPAHCPKGAPRAPPLTASGILAALSSWLGLPFRPAPAGETALPAACPLIGAAGSRVPAGETGGRRETLPTAVLPGRPFCPRPAARPRALPASGRPFLPPEGRLYSLAAQRSAAQPRRRRRRRLQRRVGPLTAKN